MTDESGASEGVVTGMRDVDELVRARVAAESDRATQRATLDSLMDPHVLSEEHYRLLAENAFDVVMHLSPDRRFEWVSGSIADVLGWAATDLLGHVIDEFVHPEELALFKHVLADARPESTASTDFRFRRSDDTFRWVLCHTKLKLDEDGTAVALVDGLVDIEARKAAVEAQELDRLAELERFQRLTVGKELKMVELKKRSKP